MAERSAAALEAAVAATGLLGGPGVVLVSCSAGRDSHCLLDLAVRIRGAAGVAVLHVDHGLREGAAADGEALAEWCGALGVALAVRHAGPRPEGSGNLHAWAREARMRLADEEAARIGAVAIATAHTRTDLVETALMRLATQPGRRALLSMRAREGLRVRPLLGLTREETGAYCRARGLHWRDDPSNADPRYARARLRHGVVPVLRSLNPDAEAAVARTLEELTEEREVLDALVAAELPPRGDVQGAPGSAEIELSRLALLAPPLARLVLRELCERALGAPAPRAAARLDDVLALGAAAARQGTGSVDVGGGARLELRRGVIRCTRSEGPAAPRP